VSEENGRKSKHVELFVRFEILKEGLWDILSCRLVIPVGTEGSKECRAFASSRPAVLKLFPCLSQNDVSNVQVSTNIFLYLNEKDEIGNTG